MSLVPNVVLWDLTTGACTLRHGLGDVDALALSPEIAADIRGAFIERLEGDGPQLYRMLWGYTPEQLAGGGAKQLIEYLDHQRLEFRVLAFWNLKTLTGLGLHYRPEYPEVRRIPSIRQWRERLESGQLLSAAAPESREKAPPQ